jgi:hypothetical protein
MNTDFPEHLFPANHNYYSYQKNIELGKQTASEKSIIFCGIVRNAENFIERNILRILRTAKTFKKFEVFIYENDSTDKTKDILSQYNKPPITIISENGIADDYLEMFKLGKDKTNELRCNILSKCRNKYIDYLNKTDYDLTCIVDLDLRGGWSYDGFYDSIEFINRSEDIACVSAYGILVDHTNNLELEKHNPRTNLMYDSLAFRPYGYDKSLTHTMQSQFNFLKTNRGDSPLLVYSNFNGIAIYKTKYIKNKQYGTKIYDKYNPVDCDHVIMHEQIRKNNGKIFLNPNLIVSYSHHGYSKS